MDVHPNIPKARQRKRILDKLVFVTDEQDDHQSDQLACPEWDHILPPSQLYALLA